MLISPLLFMRLGIYTNKGLYLFINHLKLNVVKMSNYFGLIINKNNDWNETALLK
jgi:hypothetical protein